MCVFHVFGRYRPAQTTIIIGVWEQRSENGLRMAQNDRSEALSNRPARKRHQGNVYQKSTKIHSIFALGQCSTCLEAFQSPHAGLHLGLGGQREAFTIIYHDILYALVC